MSLDNSIILVTNNEEITELLRPKLVLLREVDNTLTVKYTEAFEKIKEVLPEVVLIYCDREKEDCLSIIRKIKTDEKTKTISVLLLIEKYNQDFILNAYDENISDFLTTSADDAEILIRVIWCFKKTFQLKTIKKQNRLFEELEIRDKITGFYTNKYCREIFSNEIKSLKEMNTESILMLVGPNEQDKPKFDSMQMVSAIKKSIRNTDTVVHGVGEKFFILLSETQLKGAFKVWDKIKQSFGDEVSIVASLTGVEEKPFEEMEKELLNAFIEAESTGQDLIIVSEEETSSADDWLGKMGSVQKNFKLFKQAFNKKLEKVITPVFFQMQKLYEEKLFETQIEQYSNETLSEFILRRSDMVSELKITYPGFSKINIDIIHQGLDSPENRRISLDLAELSDSSLTQIVEDFIAEFKA